MLVHQRVHVCVILPYILYTLTPRFRDGWHQITDGFSDMECVFDSRDPQNQFDAPCTEYLLTFTPKMAQM